MSAQQPAKLEVGSPARQCVIAGLSTLQALHQPFPQQGGGESFSHVTLCRVIHGGSVRQAVASCSRSNQYGCPIPIRLLQESITSCSVISNIDYFETVVPLHDVGHRPILYFFVQKFQSIIEKINYFGKIIDFFKHRDRLVTMI